MTEVVKHSGGRQSLLAKFGAKYSLDPAKVYETLCKTAFKDAQNQEQVIALLVVSDQYGLNPFTKEIYAFPDKSGGVVPVVGIDGWNRIAQQHVMFDGVELRYADKLVKPDGGKTCPEWIEAVVYRKDREHPIVAREYLDECYRKTGPWQSHTKRMLRHKALIQGYRMAFGFHGIYDPDEAETFIEGHAVEVAAAPVADRVLAHMDAPEVDVLTGEVIEQATSAATLPQDEPERTQATTEASEAPDDEYGDSGDDDAFWPTDEEPPGMDAESFKASRPRSAAEAGQRAAETAAKARAERPISAKQVNLVHTQCAIHGVDEHADLIPWLGDNLGVASVEAIPAARLDEALAWIKSHEKGAS